MRIKFFKPNTPELVDGEDFSSGTIRNGSWRSIPTAGVDELMTPLSSNNYSQMQKICAIDMLTILSDQEKFHGKIE
ncbi:unnamed protein product [Arctia plantaginis]|uniref:Uncharacterized protein n=1 Tax=Arctia plantaginis TaxID=874455 RepID=A0A8S0Z989_ARCPL|nr:unnamed protein product [Arctia plantaginis]